MNETESQKRTLLLVDGNPKDLELLRQTLDEPAFELVEAGSVAAALEAATKCQPALVLSEAALPDGSGFSLCRQLRDVPGLGSVPIVLVSRWSQESDRILGFECGADDFLAKPFFPRELASRVRAVLRRGASFVERDPAAVGRASLDALVIDFERGEALCSGERLPLTPREFSLLAALAQRRGRVLSRSELIEQVWSDGDGPDARSVDAHVKSLRRKLGEAREAIETVRGVGYRFTENGVAPSVR